MWIAKQELGSKRAIAKLNFENVIIHTVLATNSAPEIVKAVLIAMGINGGVCPLRVKWEANL